MVIDFTPVNDGSMKVLELSKQHSLDDLRQMTNELFDEILAILGDANDFEMVHLPFDPLADDPHAVEGEEKIGWSLAHLVVHVTAGVEEGAAYASLLARGTPTAREPRPRYETSWHDVTTREQVLQRLAESRRMCLAYLDTFPDVPFLDNYRDLPPRYLELFGEMNAPAAYLFGFWHLAGHLAQFRDARQQAADAWKNQKSGL